MKLNNSPHRLIRIHMMMICLLYSWSCNQPDKAAVVNIDSTATNQAASTEWLKTLYSKSIDSNLFNTESLQVVYYRELNDSVSYCIFQMTDELCLTTFLATQVNRHNKQIRQLEENCDGDFSQPEYTYSEFRFDSSAHIFTTTEYVEKANREFLINVNGEKRFKDGYNMDNASTTKDSMAVVRKVMPDGSINEISK